MREEKSYPRNKLPVQLPQQCFILYANDKNEPKRTSAVAGPLEYAPHAQYDSTHSTKALLFGKTKIRVSQHRTVYRFDELWLGVFFFKAERAAAIGLLGRSQPDHTGANCHGTGFDE